MGEKRGSRDKGKKPVKKKAKLTIMEKRKRKKISKVTCVPFLVQ